MWSRMLESLNLANLKGFFLSFWYCLKQRRHIADGVFPCPAFGLLMLLVTDYCLDFINNWNVTKNILQVHIIKSLQTGFRRLRHIFFMFLQNTILDMFRSQGNLLSGMCEIWMFWTTHRLNLNYYSKTT
jgi:hypothetical protein